MFEGKKILLTAYSLGSTSEEVSLYKYLKRHGARDVTALYWGDENHASKMPDDIKKIEIADANSIDDIDLSSYDLIFRHPTTRPDKLPYSTAVTTATKYFFDNCPAEIIAITGTKGKGTTSSLIARMLSQAGRRVHLIGNIGSPALDALDDIGTDDIVVFEISSFQLWDLEKSPHIAVVLMMAEDHQDVHTSIEEYIKAKHNIVAYQNAEDLVYMHPTNEMTHAVVGEPASQVKRYLSDDAANVVDGNIIIEENLICSVDEVGLIGSHNLENICAAVSVVWNYSQDIEQISAILQSFKGLEHRLEPVADINGVSYVNDSFSTSSTSAIAAMRAFSQPKIMIFGGSSKGLSYDDLASVVVNENIRKVLLIGETAQSISESFEKIGFSNFENLGTPTMEQIVEHSTKVAEEGDVVVLSPACASFDMFESYKARGKQFKAAVNELS